MEENITRVKIYTISSILVRYNDYLISVFQCINNGCFLGGHTDEKLAHICNTIVIQINPRHCHNEILKNIPSQEKTKIYLIM